MASSRLRGRILLAGLLVGILVAGVLALVIRPPWAYPGGGRPAGAPAGTSAGASTGPGNATSGGTGARLRQVDGGAGYYARFSPALPAGPAFFPIGVWFEGVTQAGDVQRDRAAGINTYVELTADSDLGMVRRAGMYAMVSANRGNGSETVAWLLNDEADMAGGPGYAPWDGQSCQPSTARCGYTMMQDSRARYPRDRRMRYANYGKGVTFWETDAEARRFVNAYQDVVSADNYWFTDEDVCAESQGGTFYPPARLVGGNLPGSLCHLAANYGRTVERVRSLVAPRGSKPVWGFVELGHPSTHDSWPAIQPAQVAAAVWSSIIHGARGIIYFNHSFGGRCQTQHVLRDPCYTAIRAAVTRVNGQVRALAPVLNAPFADGVVNGSGGVDVSTRWYGGHFYVLAGSNRPGAQTASFAAPCIGGARVTVVGEGRTLALAGGGFTDRFADANAVHVYRIDGGSSCGAS